MVVLRSSGSSKSTEPSFVRSSAGNRWSDANVLEAVAHSAKNYAPFRAADSGIIEKALSIRGIPPHATKYFSKIATPMALYLLEPYL